MKPKQRSMWGGGSGALVALLIASAAHASEIAAPQQGAANSAAGGQGAVVAPAESGQTSIGSAPARQVVPGSVGEIEAPARVRSEVVTGGVTATAAPQGSASAISSGEARQGVTPHSTETTATQGRVLRETSVSATASSAAATKPEHVESAEAAAAGVSAAMPRGETTAETLLEERAAGVTGESVAVKQSRRETARAQTLAETSNVRVEEKVARLSSDLAWNVNQSQALAVRMRTEELRKSGAVAEQTVRTGTQAVLSRREVLAASTAQQSAESVVRSAPGVQMAAGKTAEETSAASTRVEVAAGSTLVYVSARNVSEEVVERPVVEIVLPQGMRYEAVASAPPNTAVRVLRTEQGETVEMVLPFALFQREAAQVVVETSPAPETGVSELRARVRPFEEGVRVLPEGAETGVVPQAGGSTAVREHLHPRQ